MVQFKYSLICQVLFFAGDGWSVVEEIIETGWKGSGVFKINLQVENIKENLKAYFEAIGIWKVGLNV